MIQYIKNKLFKEENARIRREEGKIEELKVDLEFRIRDAAQEEKRLFEARRELRNKYYTAEPTITDMVRHSMKGFNTRLFDGVKLSMNSQGGIDVLSSIFDDAKLKGIERNGFLADVKTLSENRALPIIFDYIRRNQMVFTNCAARTMEQVNFGGASINGVNLVEDEIASLRSIFEAENAPKEEYDVHKAV